MFDRFFHQINAPSSFAISQIFYCKKEAWAMQELFIKKKKKKREKKEELKNGQVSELSKQWVLRCQPEKEEEMNKIAHVFLQMFSSFKREMFSRSTS
jgi:CRISPR/Cas system-associated exonuclease Cas4 (RecB family)